MKLTKKRSRLDTRKFFFSQRVVNGWNRLPVAVVNAESVNAFKNAYDRNYRNDMDVISQWACRSINPQVQVLYNDKYVSTQLGSEYWYGSLSAFGSFRYLPRALAFFPVPCGIYSDPISPITCSGVRTFPSAPENIPPHSVAHRILV